MEDIHQAFVRTMKEMSQFDPDKRHQVSRDRKVAAVLHVLQCPEAQCRLCADSVLTYLDRGSADFYGQGSVV